MKTVDFKEFEELFGSKKTEAKEKSTVNTKREASGLISFFFFCIDFDDHRSISFVHIGTLSLATK